MVQAILTLFALAVVGSLTLTETAQQIINLLKSKDDKHHKDD